MNSDKSPFQRTFVNQVSTRFIRFVVCVGVGVEGGGGGNKYYSDPIRTIVTDLVSWIASLFVAINWKLLQFRVKRIIFTAVYA